MSCAGTMIVLLLAGIPAGSEQLSDADILQHAESAFARGVQARDRADEARMLFQEAARSYHDLTRRGLHNTALYRNLGNAALLAGDLPQAILAYRKGLQLAPGDRLLQANLDYARQQVDYPEPGRFARPPVDHRPPWLPRLAPGWQLVLAVGFYCLTCLAVTRWWMLRRGRMVSAAAAAGIITAILAAGLLFEDWRNRQELHHPVVVIADDGVLMRKGNGLSYPPRYETPVNRGVEARLLFARGAWLQIELAGGEIGWVPSDYTKDELQ